MLAASVAVAAEEVAVEADSCSASGRKKGTRDSCSCSQSWAPLWPPTARRAARACASNAAAVKGSVTAMAGMMSVPACRLIVATDDRCSRCTMDAQGRFGLGCEGLAAAALLRLPC